FVRYWPILSHCIPLLPVHFQMVKILIFLVITFAVCWLPIQTFNLVMWVCDSCRNSFNTPFRLSVYYIISFACQWLSIAHSLLGMSCLLSARLPPDSPFR